MTHKEAMVIVLEIASSWGENAEEAFPRRLQATDTDDDLVALAENEYELEEAKTIRNLWQAIVLLNKEEGLNNDPATNPL